MIRVARSQGDKDGGGNGAVPKLWKTAVQKPVHQTDVKGTEFGRQPML
jgi:hypothetical protein